MGLDFSHGRAHWSYGSFNGFRIKLAKEIRITLDKMQGFGGANSWDFEKDNIVPLLNHSDCEGELSVQECKRIWPRLKELIGGWEDDDYDKINALGLIDGMKEAIEKNESLKFS